MKPEIRPRAHCHKFECDKIDEAVFDQGGDVAVREVIQWGSETFG
jgi:hypothetical protein